jgi:uncharacterized membrane protein YphA (DoxX/SURF4 family)
LFIHGTDKLLNFKAYSETFPSILGIQGPLLLAIATIAQLPCMVPVAFGYGVRYFSIPALATLLAAVIFVHVPNGAASAETAVVYGLCLTYFIAADVRSVTGRRKSPAVAERATLREAVSPGP